jgi:hypothetical protein
MYVQLELFLSTRNMREICGELPTDQDVSETGIGGRRGDREQTGRINERDRQETRKIWKNGAFDRQDT